MKFPTFFPHMRDIMILPVTVTCVVPYLIFEPGQHFIPAHRIAKLGGAVSLAFGLGLFILTLSLFVRVGKGTLAPWSPTQKLVVAGPYRYCRNPMITGVLFILLGEAFLLHSTSILIWAGCFVLINTVYFILSEEPGLDARFGEDYRNYKRHVPRWIPRLTPYEQ